MLPNPLVGDVPLPFQPVGMAVDVGKDGSIVVTTDDIVAAGREVAVIRRVDFPRAFAASLLKQQRRFRRCRDIRELGVAAVAVDRVGVGGGGAVVFAFIDSLVVQISVESSLFDDEIAFGRNREIRVVDPIAFDVGTLEVVVERGKALLVVVPVHVERQREHLQVVDAVGGVCRSACFGQCRKQKACQDGDDANDHQKLNQCEGVFGHVENDSKGKVALANVGMVSRSVFVHFFFAVSQEIIDFDFGFCINIRRSHYPMNESFSCFSIMLGNDR